MVWNRQIESNIQKNFNNFYIQIFVVCLYTEIRKEKHKSHSFSQLKMDEMKNKKKIWKKIF